MTSFKIPAGALPFNTVDILNLRRDRHDIQTISNNWLTVTRQVSSVDKYGFNGLLSLYHDKIAQYTKIKFAVNQNGLSKTPSFRIHIAPAFLSNIIKLLKKQTDPYKNVRDILYTNAFTNFNFNSFDNAVSIITQCHCHIENDINHVYMTGFSLCMGNKLIFSYNMKPISLEGLIKLADNYYLLSNKDIWWLPNWVEKKTATKDQIKLSETIRYPKYLSDALKARNKKLLDGVVSVQPLTLEKTQIEEKEMINQAAKGPFIMPPITSTPEKSDAYRKIVKAISEGKVIYFENNEVIDVAYSTTLKNKHLLTVFIKGSETPVNIESSDFSKFAIVEKVKLF